MTTYDVISLGGGVQSSVMYLMANMGLITPRPVSANIADTGWEPADVYKHLDWLEEFSIPIVRVSNGRNLRNDVFNLVSQDDHNAIVIPAMISRYDGGRGMLRRQCTDKYKVRPIVKWTRENILGLQPRQRAPEDVRVSQWLGISTDEVLRMKDSSGFPWQDLRYPLIELGMSREDCRRWFASEFPDRTLPRSACSGCPYRSDREWLHLKQTNPADFQDAVDVDRNLREAPNRRIRAGLPYLNQRLLPLDEAVADYERELEMNPMLPGLESGADNECAGVCFV